MIEHIKKILRYTIIPIYLTCFFFDLYSGIGGQVLGFILLYIAMWAFVRRKLKVWNYIFSALLMAFYFLLFWTSIFDETARLLSLPDRWVFYGLLYTILVIGFGIYVLKKRWHDKYQVARTLSVMGVQLLFAFILPQILKIMIKQEYYFSYLWPLKIEYFYPSVIFQYPLPIVYYSFIASLIIVPGMALLFGKRFYCSWICGCGGLAETFDDRWRRLSDTSTSVWRFEKVAIHVVLALCIFTTAIGQKNLHHTREPN